MTLSKLESCGKLLFIQGKKSLVQESKKRSLPCCSKRRNVLIEESYTVFWNKACLMFSFITCP